MKMIAQPPNVQDKIFKDICIYCRDRKRVHKHMLEKGGSEGERVSSSSIPAECGAWCRALSQELGFLI